jgi:AhpC/TSA antioxidant enzyme
VQVHRARQEIQDRGAELAIVGNGAALFVRAFREDLGLDVPVYTDPSLETYRALAFHRGLARTVLSPRTWAHAARALAGGFYQGRTRGDPLQLGGVVVVRPDGTVAYRYASAEAGDHPPIADILAALGPRPTAAATRA